MNRRLIRYSLLGLSLLVLFSLSFAPGLAGPIWDRAGGGAGVWYMRVEIICADGMIVSVASFSERYTANVSAIDGLGVTPVLVDTNIPLKYFPGSRPDVSGDAAGAEYLALGVIVFWDPATTVAPGSTVSVVVDGNLGQAGDTIQFVQDCVIADLFNKANFRDGRENKYDPWGSVAIYCQDGMVKIYAINAQGQGSFALAVTNAEIKALGTPAENTLVASAPHVLGSEVRLYVLASGEVQVNAPGLPPETWKGYVFKWAGCA
jgi:hypothetical protein